MTISNIREYSERERSLTQEERNIITEKYRDDELSTTQCEEVISKYISDLELTKNEPDKERYREFREADKGWKYIIWGSRSQNAQRLNYRIRFYCFWWHYNFLWHIFF